MSDTDGDADSSVDVFVYGTLTDPAQAHAVLGHVDYRGPAVLEGLHRVDGTYPTLVPGGSVSGRILRTDDVAALDRYEGVDGGLYVRVSVPLADGDAASDVQGERTATGGGGASTGTGETVEVYVGDPDRLDAPAEWPGDGPFSDRVRAFLRDADVGLRPGDGKTYEDFEGDDGDAVTDATTDHDTWGTE